MKQFSGSGQPTYVDMAPESTAPYLQYPHSTDRHETVPDLARIHLQPMRSFEQPVPREIDGEPPRTMASRLI